MGTRYERNDSDALLILILFGNSLFAADQIAAQCLSKFLLFPIGLIRFCRWL